MRKFIPLAFLYSGTLPFCVGVPVMMFPNDFGFLPILYPAFLYFYAMYITQFIIGSHWGYALSSSNRKILTHTIIVTFIAAIIFIVATNSFMYPVFFALFIPLFWILFGLEKQYALTSDIFDNYMMHRFVATIIVTFCLLAISLISKG